MPEQPNDFVLYLLLRKDMESLNHMGKAIAQGAHAANHAAAQIGSGAFGPTVMAQFAQWEKQTTQGFGTTIVLSGTSWAQTVVNFTIARIRETIDLACSLGFAAGITGDPSYPLLDGQTTHAFPCETIGWIFGSKSTLSNLVSQFALHPAGIN